MSSRSERYLNRLRKRSNSDNVEITPMNPDIGKIKRPRTEINFKIEDIGQRRETYKLKFKDNQISVLGSNQNENQIIIPKRRKKTSELKNIIFKGVKIDIKPYQGDDLISIQDTNQKNINFFKLNQNQKFKNQLKDLINNLFLNNERDIAVVSMVPQLIMEDDEIEDKNYYRIQDYSDINNNYSKMFKFQGQSVEEYFDKLQSNFQTLIDQLLGDNIDEISQNVRRYQTRGVNSIYIDFVLLKPKIDNAGGKKSLIQFNIDSNEVSSIKNNNRNRTALRDELDCFYQSLLIGGHFLYVNNNLPSKDLFENKEIYNQMFGYDEKLSKTMKNAIKNVKISIKQCKSLCELLNNRYGEQYNLFNGAQGIPYQDEAKKIHQTTLSEIEDLLHTRLIIWKVEDNFTYSEGFLNDECLPYYQGNSKYKQYIELYYSVKNEHIDFLKNSSCLFRNKSFFCIKCLKHYYAKDDHTSCLDEKEVVKCRLCKQKHNRDGSIFKTCDFCNYDFTSQECFDKHLIQKTTVSQNEEVKKYKQYDITCSNKRIKCKICKIIYLKKTGHQCFKEKCSNCGEFVFQDKYINQQHHCFINIPKNIKTQDNIGFFDIETCKLEDSLYYDENDENHVENKDNQVVTGLVCINNIKLEQIKQLSNYKIKDVNKHNVDNFIKQMNDIFNPKNVFICFQGLDNNNNPENIMLKFLKFTESLKPGTILFAHNGSNYDFQFIKNHLIENGNLDFQSLDVDNSILSLKYKNVIFRDSFRIYPERLAGLKNNLFEKSHFPHKVNRKDRLFKPQSLASKSDFGYDQMSSDDMLKFDTWYDNELKLNKTYYYDQEIIYYCLLDVLTLNSFMLELREKYYIFTNTDKRINTKPRNQVSQINFIQMLKTDYHSLNFFSDDELLNFDYEKIIEKIENSVLNLKHEGRLYYNKIKAYEHDNEYKKVLIKDINDVGNKKYNDSYILQERLERVKQYVDPVKHHLNSDDLFLATIQHFVGLKDVNELHSFIDPLGFLTLAGVVDYLFRRQHMKKDTISFERSVSNHNLQSKIGSIWIEYLNEKLAVKNNIIEPEYKFFLKDCRNINNDRLLNHYINEYNNINFTNRTVDNKWFSVDGYDSKNKTCYEFMGCFYHSCEICYKNQVLSPKMLQKRLSTELRLKMLKLHPEIKENIVIMTECEFRKLIKGDKQLNSKYNNFYKDLPDFIKSYHSSNTEKNMIRDSLYGGKCFPKQVLFENKKDENKRIIEIDINSSYPTQLRNNHYFSGPAKDVYRHLDLKNPVEIQKVFEYKNGQYQLKPGLYECNILPPIDKEKIPVLPTRFDNKLIFPKCFVCMKNKQAICDHGYKERLIHGSYNHVDLNDAIKNGYIITYIFKAELYNTRDDIFKSFFDKYYTMKFCSDKKSLDSFKRIFEKDLENLSESQIYRKYIKGFNENMRFTSDQVITREDLCFNKSDVDIYKLIINSLWGHFSMRLHEDKTLYIRSFDELYNKIKGVDDEQMINLKCYENIWILKEKSHLNIQDNKNQNVMIGSLTTSYGRVHLHRLIEKIGYSDVVYGDTDSVYFISDRDNSRNSEGLGIDYRINDEIGVYLGQCKPKDVYFNRFYSAGPKIKVCCVSEQNKTFNSLKGAKLNYQNQMKLVNNIKDHIISSYENTSKQEVNFECIQFSKNCKGKVNIHDTKKKFDVCFDKGVLTKLNDDNYQILDFGSTPSKRVINEYNEFYNNHYENLSFLKPKQVKEKTKHKKTCKQEVKNIFIDEDLCFQLNF